MPIPIEKRISEKLNTTQKKVAKAMNEFLKGALHVGKSDTIVRYRKQAIAIALSETENLKKISHYVERRKQSTKAQL